MTGNIGNAKKKRELTKREKVVIVFFLLFLAVAVTGFLTFGTNKAQKQAAEQKKAVTLKNEQDMYAVPLMTAADTDSKRRYGYDVLYAHKNLRIVLTKSMIRTNDPEITFDIINDSKKDMNVQLACGAIDNKWFDMKMDCTVKSHETGTAAIHASNEYFTRYPIEIVRLCFKVTNLADGSESYSDTISIKYSEFTKEPSWNIGGKPISRLQTEDFELFSNSYENDVNVLKGVMTNHMDIRNDSDTTIKFRIEDSIVLDADGNVIPPEDYEISYEGIIPGYSLYDKDLTLTMTKDTDRIERIKRIGFNFIYERLGESYESEESEESGEHSEWIGITHSLS